MMVVHTQAIENLKALRAHRVVDVLCRVRVLAVSAVLALTGCMVGPKYHRPTAPVTDNFKEPAPTGWKQAQPNAAIPRGKWWEIYNDPELNALEEHVNISNQNVLLAEAQYREARDTVRIARAGFYPSITTSPGIT